MAESAMISDYVSDGLDTIESGETVRSAQRRMEAQTLRSLIVVDGDRPVGVVKWRDLRTADADSTVATCMTTDFPVLRHDMRVEDAHGHIGDVDFDNIPVVDEEGRLVGEVPRGAVVHRETSSTEADHVAPGGAPVTTADAGPAWDIQAGMDVVDIDDDKLGKVTEVQTDPTTHRLSHFLVEHGLLRKKHKRLPVDTINRIEDGKVILAIGKTEFGFLNDVEDDDI